jgi:hypothetical protein
MATARARARAGTSAPAALLAVLVVGCAGENVAASVRTASVLDGAERNGQLEQAWARAHIADAVRLLREAFASDGSDAFLRLRLHGEEIPALFTPTAVGRVGRMSPGIAPSA